MKRKILFISGIRSDFYIQKNIIIELNNLKNIKTGIILTGANLDKSHNTTLKDIKKTKIKIIASIKSLIKSDKKEARIKSLTNQLPLIIDAFLRFKPDIVVAPYDREEAISISLVASYMNVPIIHLGAGDNTKINIDGIIRHSVSKLAHIHFTFSKSSRDRLIKMGEEKKRIYNMGHTAHDRFRNIKKISLKALSKFFNLDINNDPIILLIQHPVSNNYEKSKNEIFTTLKVIDRLNLKTIIIYPNTDLGSNSIISQIKKFKFKNKNVRICKTIPEIYFVNLIRKVSLLLGNSSMGLLEAPYLKIPVVNVGKRQTGRINPGNVIFVPHSQDHIIKAVKKSLYNEKYLKKISKIKLQNVKTNISKKIAIQISKIKINKDLLQKINTY